MFSSNFDTLHLFNLGYRHNGSGKIGVVMCSRAWAQIKALFAICGGIVLQPLDDMVVLTCNGPIDNVIIESSSSMEGKSTLTFQTKGVQICTPFTNSIEGLSRSTNNDAQIF
jgi:hypothetical protein